MIIAAFDTSTGLSLAVAENEQIILETAVDQTSNRRGIDMAQWLSQNLDAIQLRPAEITRWTVGIGPGSFVGLRCGMALIKGICTQSAAQVRGLPSSLAVASTDEILPASRIAVLNDARRGEVILTLYKRQNGIVQPVDAPTVNTPEKLLAFNDGDTCFASVQADILAERLPESIQERLVVLEHIPAAKLLAPPGWPWPDAPEAIEKSTDPIYVRPPVFVKPTIQ